MFQRVPLSVLCSLSSLAVLSGCFVNDEELKDRSDYDGDGIPLDSDCDDSRADVGAPVSWYADVDGDGFGAGEELSGCPDEKPSTNTADNADDCDDSDPGSYPGAEERYYDGVDQDCAGEDADGNGSVDDFDQDGDGYEDSVDCDDLDPNLKPDDSIDEVHYDGIDNDCNKDTGDGDKDGDGYWSVDYRDKAPGSDLLPKPGFEGDCYDDVDAPEQPADPLNGLSAIAPEDVNPSITEDDRYDGIDARCDGDADEFDADGDGYDSAAYANRDGGTGPDCQDCTSACTAEPEWTSDLDSDEINPDANESYYDGIDQDCAGIDSQVPGVEADYDQDGDGYVVLGSTDAFGNVGDDCLDTDARIAPGNEDIPANGLDEDCGGENDYDLDGDGYVPDAYFGLPTLGAPGRETDPGGDCVDDPSSDGVATTARAANYHPDQFDIWVDGYDLDCAGNDDFDRDGDGYRDDDPTLLLLADLATRQRYDIVVAASATTADDCDDTDATVFTGAASAEPSLCVFDGDGDGYGDDSPSGSLDAGTDCDDADASVNPAATEIGGNGVDDNCDGGAAPEGIEGTNSAALFTGAAVGDTSYGFGLSVALGDLDADGQPEIITSNRYYHGSGSYRGRLNWFAAADVIGDEVAAGDAAGELVGDEDYQQVSSELLVTDITSDGVADLIVSSPNVAQETGSGDGATYVFAGPISVSSSSPVSWTTDNADYVAAGESAGFLGTHIATGDVLGNPTDDLIVSAPNISTTYNYQGAVMIWAPDVSSGFDNERGAVTLYGPSDYYYLGDGDLLATDLTGDGTPELIIGSTQVSGTYTSEGYVDILSSPLGGPAYIYSYQIGQVAGGADYAACGSSLASADFNFDGYDDLAIGCPGTSGGGAVAVFWGDSSGIIANSFLDADFLIEGSASVNSGELGTTIAFADVDGDGKADLLAGEPYYTESSVAYYVGRVAMMLGGSASGTSTADTADGVIVGDTTQGMLGRGLAGGEDVDGDGYDDVLIGRPGVNLNGQYYGDALLFTGGEW